MIDLSILSDKTLNKDVKITIRFSDLEVKLINYLCEKYDYNDISKYIRSRLIQEISFELRIYNDFLDFFNKLVDNIKK